jgi:hypothetical protein
VGPVPKARPTAPPQLAKIGRHHVQRSVPLWSLLLDWVKPVKNRHRQVDAGLLRNGFLELSILVDELRSHYRWRLRPQVLTVRRVEILGSPQITQQVPSRTRAELDVTLKPKSKLNTWHVPGSHSQQT